MKKIIKSLIIATIMSLQCITIFATTGAADDLQNFLNGYLAKAGVIVCIAGAVEICTSFASSSADKRFKGLKMFGVGLVLVSINEIINTILR
ncbi:UNVERIFIED_ORG: hypothetical protein B2H98_08165 [Clostridium botulinum]